MFWCVLNIPALGRTVVSLWCYVACLCFACIDVVFSISHPNINLAWCIAFRSTSMMWIFNLIYIYIYVYHIFCLCKCYWAVLSDQLKTQDMPGWQFSLLRWRPNFNEQQGEGWGLITYGFPKSHTVPDDNTYMPFCHICSRHSAESVLHIKDQGLGVLMFFCWISWQMSAGISLQRPPEISCSYWIVCQYVYMFCIYIYVGK